MKIALSSILAGGSCLLPLNAATVSFETSGGFLTGVRFSEDLTFTVTETTMTTGLNGYYLLLKNAYTGLGGFTFDNASGQTITVNAMRAGNPAEDRDFDAFNAGRGNSGGTVVGSDLFLRYQTNNSGLFEATVGTTIVIPGNDLFLLDDGQTLEAPNNLGGNVTTYIAAVNDGARVTGDIIVNVPEPSSFALLGLGCLGFISRRRRV